MKKLISISIVLFCFLGNNYSQIPTNGLVAFYPFNGNANDESGNVNNGNIYGATLTTDRFSKINSAYYFPGVDNNIQIPYNETLEPSIFSISVWFKAEDPIDSTESPIISNDPDQSRCHHGYMIWCTYWGILFHVDGSTACGTGGGSSYNGPIFNNGWHHVVAIYNGRHELYVDGKLSYTSDYQDYPKTNAYINIGCQISSRGSLFYKGTIDDIRIYNRALSKTEINTLYHENGWDPKVSSVPALSKQNLIILTLLLLTLGTVLLYSHRKSPKAHLNKL
jgi:hypothetical protein